MIVNVSMCTCTCVRAYGQAKGQKLAFLRAVCRVLESYRTLLKVSLLWLLSLKGYSSVCRLQKAGLQLSPTHTRTHTDHSTAS